MGSSTKPPSATGADFPACFRAHAGSDGLLSFARFMELALYDPHAGYYRRDRPRVGYGRGTDFFTASTSGAVFGELVAAACVTLLGGCNPRDFTFVEIGAEPAGGVLSEIAHPFGRTRTVRVGEPLILSGPCVVFSNELFDAQPFRRFVFRRGAWRELGVALSGNAFTEVELSSPPDAPWLPAAAEENHVLDAPLAARTLAGSIAAQPWTGLFVACDYG
jgi:SAM-dependent MidA family methyltransferase